MLKAVKTTLAILMLIGCMVIFLAIITGRINLIIGLPLFVLPMALVISYFFPKLINNKNLFSYLGKNNQENDLVNISYQEPKKTEITTPKFSEINNKKPINSISENLKDISKVQPSKQITASCNDEFYKFLLSIVEKSGYFISIKEQLSNILVFNKQNSDYAALNKFNLNYVIRQKDNQNVVMVINIYEEDEDQKSKLQLVKLFNKVKIPLLALHSKQSYIERDLIEAISHILYQNNYK